MVHFIVNFFIFLSENGENIFKNFRFFQFSEVFKTGNGSNGLPAYQYISKEDLTDHFTLTQDERYHLPLWREERNILGFAVLLKTFKFLGFPPRDKKDIPNVIVLCLSRQMKIDSAEYEKI
jgi:hypothetical protein